METYDDKMVSRDRSGSERDYKKPGADHKRLRNPVVLECTFNDLHLVLERLAILDCDDPLLAHLLHGLTITRIHHDRNK